MSDTDSWCTPVDVLDAIRQIAWIELDPCGCEGDNVHAPFSVRPPDDGLAYTWSEAKGLVYVNPPYSKPRPWVEKMLREVYRGVLLLPATPDTSWFHALARSPRTTVAIFAGRLAFMRNGAPVKGNRQGSVIALVSDLLMDHLEFRRVFRDRCVFLERIERTP